MAKSLEELDARQFILNELGEYFKVMYGCFGLSEQPQIPNFSFRLLFAQGVYYDDKKLIYYPEECINGRIGNFYRGFDEFEYTIAHENGHAMHHYSRPDDFDVKHKGDYALADIVSGFAALLFLEKRYGEDIARFSEFCYDGWEMIVPDLLNNVKDKRKFLKRISSLRMQQARPILLRTLKRDHIYTDPEDENEIQESLDNLSLTPQLKEFYLAKSF